MHDYEKPGSFYLGRLHDLASGATRPQPLLYDSKDLTTHAVCVGMTGSGKTGLCLSLLEEAALDGVPALAIDPKDDLGNLLLAFPKLEPGDFRPWIDESEAARTGITPDELAARSAELWRSGLAKWDQGPERIQAYLDGADRVIYTPGSSAGIPLTVLKSFAAPPAALRDDADAFRERVSSAASGVLALLGIDADPVRSREHIFLSNLLDAAWRAGRNLDLARLIGQIQDPPLERIGVMDLETFYPPDDRLALAMKLNNLLASPSFAGWMQGEPLDIKRLLYTAEGRPRLAILSIAHLNDAERMFFVTILLNELIAWMRTQQGTGSLRALLYMDEVFGYFPPVANPPSKRPMLTLMKQARAFGIGCVLATQNPVDLDYKGLSNAGTWFLGRLQTERDKARVLEGLEGASAEAGAAFDRQQMEATLAGLGSRVFLMNNVHEDRPQVFHTRWAMSFLCGPLARGQIKILMDPVRDRMAGGDEAGEAPGSAEGGAAAVGGEARDSAKDGAAAAGEERVSAATVSGAVPEAESGARPELPAEIEQRFMSLKEVVGQGGELVYRPALLGVGKLHFVHSPSDVDVWREMTVIRSEHDRPLGSAWDGAAVLSEKPAVSDAPEPDGRFAALPAEVADAKNYAAYVRDLESFLYRTQELTVIRCDALDLTSEPGESEADFRIRLAQRAREGRDQEKEKLEAKYQAKLAKVEGKIERLRAARDEQRSQSWGKLGGAVLAVLELGYSFWARMATRRRTTSSISKGKQYYRERGQQRRAQRRLDDAVAEKEALEEEHREKLEQLNEKFQAAQKELDCQAIKPRKSDVVVDGVILAWLPFGRDASGVAEGLY